MRFRDRMARFMTGRYGTDKLFYVLSIVYIFLMFVNVFINSWFLYILGLVVFVYTFYRIFSRNIQKRYMENLKFLAFFSKISSFFTNRVNRFKQNKTYCFKRCPNCGKVLRLPRVKGKHGTRCPSCSCSFCVHVWFDKKKG